MFGIESTVVLVERVELLALVLTVVRGSHCLELKIRSEESERYSSISIEPEED